MSDLPDFILACIAEDEAVARAARDEAPGLTWEPEKVYDGVYSLDLGPATHPDSDSYGVGEDCRAPREIARHIARHDPARVLAECEAKRRIVEACTGVLAVNGWEYTDAPDLAEHTLRALALPYVDHPEFREEWR